MPSPAGPWQAAQKVPYSVAPSVANSRSSNRSARMRSSGQNASGKSLRRSENM